MSVDSRSDAAVYEAHARELVRFAAGLVGPDDAPDVVTDAFVRLVASPAWVEARDRRALWFRAVVFEARSLHRSGVRRRAREASVAAAARLGASTPTHGDDRVRAALEVLSAQQRAAVVLTYWQDLGPAEVAHLLGVTDGAVRKQLARARKKLKEVLG